MRPELIVAEKEFRDHITSKRFIIIFGILLLLAVYAIVTGMDAYNKALDQYKNPQLSPNYVYTQQSIESYQRMIQEAQARNDSPETIQMYQKQLDMMLNPAMPSVLNVFQSMTMLMMLVGILLGAGMGFDQIAREKDEGSIKFLASSPIFRDAIINGKTIGAIAALAGAMGAVFVIAIAIMMLMGVVPGVDDLIRLFLFFIAALLYCTVFFAVGMMVSALSRNTAMAAIFTVGMVFAVFIYTVLALLASSMIAAAIVGPAPVIDYSQYTYPVITNESAGNITAYTPPYDYSATNDYYTRLQTVQSDISSVLSAFSPIDSFSGYLNYGHPGIGPAMLTRQKNNYFMYGISPGSYETGEMSLIDSLASVWIKVLALVAEIVAAFGIAYVAFMRTDIR